MSTSASRVAEHTAESVNDKIHRDAARRLRTASADPASIGPRLQELRAEWDIERAIEANASSLAFIGVVLGFFVHLYWLALPAIVTAFLFQHAIQGWCPPVPILRRLGFRTVYEIEAERYALKAMRGDFDAVSAAPNKADAALQAVSR